MTKISVLGNGSWGSVLGSMLADNGNDVTLYGNIDSVNEEINKTHTNSHYMKDWKLNETTKATGDLEEALAMPSLKPFMVLPNILPSLGRFLGPKMIRTTMRIINNSVGPIRIICYSFYIAGLRARLYLT